MTKLEYRIIASNDSVLRQLGMEGWKMCGIQEGKMYFCREIQQVGGNYQKPQEEPKEDTRKKQVNDWIKNNPDQYNDIKSEIAINMPQEDINSISYKVNLDYRAKKQVYQLLNL